MKVILLQDVRGSGKKDQIIEVSDGFGRNYLLPRKLAREATPEAMNAVEKAQSAQKHRDDVKRQEAEAKARELKGKVIQLSVKGGAGGKLYGKVTNEAIAQADEEADSCTRYLNDVLGSVEQHLSRVLDDVHKNRIEVNRAANPQNQPNNPR